MACKPAAVLQQEAAHSGFKRTLSTLDVTLLGVGVVVGTGVFVLTGRAAAANAGPAVCVSFLLAALVAGLAALCYAELASLFPVAGSVYAYTSVSMGELAAFLIGWDLMLEYVIGAATVGVGWSAYAVALLETLLGHRLPQALCQAPLRWDTSSGAFAATGAIVNAPAVLVILGVTLLLLCGAKKSTRLNTVLVSLKMTLIGVFVAVCAFHIEPRNLRPFLPANTGTFGHFGVSGVLRGASLLVFAYLGIDNLSTAALETRDPQRALPRAIFATLGVCTLLYVAVGIVMCGVVPYGQLDVAHPIAVAAAATGLHRLALLCEVAAVFGLMSVLLVQLYGMPRIFFSMARDNLLPAVVAKLSKRAKVPYVATLMVGSVCAALAGALPIDVLGELCSSGTLFAFILVSLSVTVLRRRHPELTRSFAVPFGPYVIPISSALICGFLLALSGVHTLFRLGLWLLLGMVVYILRGIGRAHGAAVK